MLLASARHEECDSDGTYLGSRHNLITPRPGLELYNRLWCTRKKEGGRNRLGCVSTTTGLVLAEAAVRRRAVAQLQGAADGAWCRAEGEEEDYEKEGEEGGAAGEKGGGHGVLAVRTIEKCWGRRDLTLTTSCFINAARSSS